MEQKNTVLVTDRYHSSALHRLQLKMNCKVVVTDSKDLKPEQMPGVCALMIRSGTKIHKSLIEAASDLKVIVTATSGFDHIDLDACHKADIVVMHTPTANVQSAAELTLAQMLNLTKSTIELHNRLHSNQVWKHHYSHFGELHRKLLGLIGFGRVGQRVAVLAKAFGMDIQVYDPYVSDELIKEKNVLRVGLTELLKTSDFTSLHVPLTRETQKLINHQTLEYFNPEGYLINASRGEVICENSLIDALKRKGLRGAALDVFAKEPLNKDSRFFKFDNVIMSPHVGGYTKEAFVRASQSAADKIIRFYNDREISDPLPPNVEWAKFLINT